MLTFMRVLRQQQDHAARGEYEQRADLRLLHHALSHTLPGAPAHPSQPDDEDRQHHGRTIRLRNAGKGDHRNAPIAKGEQFTAALQRE